MERHHKSEGTIIEGGYANFWGRIKNVDANILVTAILIMIMIVMQGLLMIQMRDDTKDREMRYTKLELEQARVTASSISAIAERAVIMKALATLAEEQRSTKTEITFVLAQDPKERKEMNLQMPDSLCERSSKCNRIRR